MTEYIEAREQYLGWCTECRKFTREMTEPDARDYDCPECGLNSVLGAEEAMMEDMFELT